MAFLSRIPTAVLVEEDGKLKKTYWIKHDQDDGW